MIHFLVKTLGLGHRHLSSIMQPDFSPVGKSSPAGIRGNNFTLQVTLLLITIELFTVLENVKINPGVGTKILSHTSRLMDIPKFSVANVKSTSTNSSIIVLPDGKIKNVSSSKPGDSLLCNNYKGLFVFIKLVLLFA